MKEERAERERGSSWILKGHRHLGSSWRSKEKKGSKGVTGTIPESCKQRGGHRGTESKFREERKQGSYHSQEEG